MPANISKLVFSCAAFVALCTFVSADTIFEIFWGTHVGQNSPIDNGSDTAPSTLNNLLQLTSGGSGTQNLDATSGASTYSGDLIQLGFFDTDSSYGGTSSSISPNTSTSNYFSGTWTPLTSKTTIGQDWSGSETVGAGLFYFSSKYSQLTSPSADSDGTAISNISADSSYRITTDQLNKTNVPFPASDSNNTATNDLADRVIALNGASDATASTNPLIGIRFYDTNTVGSGITRYNTIMNPNWRWSAGGTLDMSLHASNGSSNTDLVFEYDNTDAYTLNLSKVGIGNNQVANNDFVSTITYYDGSSGLDASDGGHIFSGLSGSGNITLGDDGSDVYTLHVNGANNSSTFSGNLTGASEVDANSTIIKTGSGEQIITGRLKVLGSSAGVVIQDGKLTLAGSQLSRLESFTSASGGTPVLELNNTSIGSSPIVTIGLTEQSSADYGGSVVLNGGGSETLIQVVPTSNSGYTVTDYNKTQIFSGVVSSSSSNKLVKGGVGELELSGNNTFTGGVEIEDGTVIAGHSNALGGTNAVTITKGKFEVDSGVTLAGSATITAGNTGKTMIGGRGDLNNDITVGSGNGQVDVISPGDGISSSLSSSSSKQQLSFGDRDNAIGTFTVSDTLTLENGGVYDWEITDFTGTAGTDWDLLKFDTLNFDSTSDVFTINIMSLDENGSAGAMSGGNVWNDYTSNGFKFMEATGSGSGWAGTGSMGSSGLVSAFDVNASQWSYYNSHHLNNWNVWHDGSGSFYLQYSVAPEPSTYVMVTGLMLVPGMNAMRKYRNRKKKQGVEESEEEIRS